MEYERKAKPPGDDGGRKRGIAAEPDNRVRTFFPQQAERGKGAARQCREEADAAESAAARRRRRRHDMGDDAFHAIGVGPAAFIGEQQDALAAPDQFFRQSQGGEHVAARAAGGQHDGFSARRAHIAIPERRRVSANSIPMPNERARTDEPP